MSDINITPLLTIAVPTFNRVDLLERCLESIAGPYPQGEVELVVSDNSTNSDAMQFVARYAKRWGPSLRYFKNAEGTGGGQNFNLCCERARGSYTLILHDDDYLLPGAVDNMLDVIRDADERRDQVLLFGVRVEELSGKVLRRQYARRDTYLPPARALHRLLGDSSFVRAPGLVVRTEAYAAVDGFRVDAGTADDLDIYVRLLGRFGIRRLADTTAAYTVHAGGETTDVFNARTVALIGEIFNRARQLGVLDEPTIIERQRHWFHQFILAGAWRSLRRGDRATARQVLALFQLPTVKALGTSPRWVLLRLVFSVVAGKIRHDAARDGGPERPVANSTPEW